jgi:hypothetical protein
MASKIPWRIREGKLIEHIRVGRKFLYTTIVDNKGRRVQKTKIAK